jgi:sulfotransferase
MMTSPVGSIHMAMQGAMSREKEAAVFIGDAQKPALPSGVFAGHCHAIGEDKVFDANRVWCTEIPSRVAHFPNPKIIRRVRHISRIIDSVERLIRRNPHELSGLFGFEAGGTVYTRVNRLAMNDGLAGYALDALREACYGEHRDRLLLVEYGALTQEPQQTPDRIYEFVREPPFTHNFENVEYGENDFDLTIGAPGLHTVARSMACRPRATILPPELFQRFEGDVFWNGAGANPKVRVIGRPE